MAEHFGDGFENCNFSVISHHFKVFFPHCCSPAAFNKIPGGILSSGVCELITLTFIDTILTTTGNVLGICTVPL